jgi:microcystin-dependent protein
MTVTLTDPIRGIPFPTTEDFVDEGPANYEAIATTVGALNDGQADFLQPGVVSATDWSFTAVMETPSTCALGSTGATGGAAWFTNPSTGLLRSVTTAATLKVLKPPFIPGASSYMTVGIEIAPNKWGEGASVSVVSGPERPSQAQAEGTSPSVTAGHVRVRDVTVKNNAGTYELLSQRDRRQSFDNIHKTGDLRLTARATVDFGWLACEGQAVSRVQYPALFAEIGTTWGVGNGSTTFNLPDYRERVPVGAGAGTALGSKGGEATHKLTVGELAKHSHTSTGYFHGIGTDGSIQNAGGGTYPFDSNMATAEEGGGEPHNNLQPYTVCNVWVKY